MKSTLNIHWKAWCWSWSSNTLPTWCEEPMQGSDLLGKTLMLGKIEDRRRRGRQRMRLLNGITNWVIWVWANSGRQWRTGKPGVLQSVELQRVGHNWVTEQQQKGREREKNRRKKFLCLWNLHATGSIQVTNEIHSTFNCDKHFLERKELDRKGGQNVLRNGVGL